jgi:DHA1 family tetracycline resistance protein-like MFS transporter
MDTEKKAGSTKSAMSIVFLVVFIDLLGFGIVLPLVPLVTDGYLASRPQIEKDISIALLFSLFSLMQFIFSPFWGRLSDRIGRRPILLVSLSGSVVFYAMFAVACFLPLDAGYWAVGLMLLSRIGAGIAGASVSTASAVIADSTTKENRAKGMGLIGVAFGIGFTFGPLIAFAVLTLFPSQSVNEAIGLDPAYAWVPGATASVLSLMALIVALLKLPETRKPDSTPHGPRSFMSFGRSLSVLKIPAIGPLILVYFLAIFAFANYEATLSRFTKDVFGFDVKQNFLVFAGVGVVLMIAQGGFYRRFAGKVPELRLMLIGLICMLAGLASLLAFAFFAYQLKEANAGAAPAGLQWLFYLFSAVAVFGFAFVNPSISAMISKRASASQQGEVLGVNQSSTAIARILGPAVGSLVYGVHPSHAVPFAAAVGLLLLVLFLVPVIRRDNAVSVT